MTTQQISVKIQVKTGFDENMTSQLSIDFGTKKVFGCPIRVKTMQDVEQILSELAITNDRILLSKFDAGFLHAPVKMSFKQEHFKTCKCPADLIFQ